ncbi:MAG TPA: ABC transporter permease, partial [Blastocatellia bacterium]|nr:ABC transporter permease [Blastocatellia bacterium]
DPNIIGQSILLSGVNYTVVGIAPPLPAFWQAEVWVTNPFQLPGTSRDLLQRGVSFLAVAARLKSGVTQAQAQQELAIIAQRYQAENSGKADASWNLVTIPLRDDIIGTTRSPLFLLISTVGLVLLLACANVANLLLVNFAGRRREIALRQALGATRGLIVRQFLTESLIISILAAGLGLVLAYVSLPILIRLSQNFVPFYGEIQINQAVFLATVGVALLTGLLMGAYPAMQASRTDVASILREGGRGLTNTTGQHRIRNLLVSSQVAVSLLLLVCAVLLANSFFKLQKQPTGFSPDNVFTANLNLPQTRYQDNEAQARFYLSLNEELRQLPGVINASLIQGLPLSGNNSRSPYARAEGDVPQLKDRPLGLTRSVTPNYFATLGIALRAGRDFTERDTSDAPQAVILSSSTARKLFPDQDPLGRRVVMGSQNGRGLEMEVIGIVDDVRSQSLAQTPDVEFYRPVMQRPSAFMQLVVRTQGDAAAFAPTAQQLLKRLDAELPLNNSSTLAEVVAQSLGQQQLLFTLLGVFAALALVLSSVGIYSVVAYVTAQRTSEIGVRMAPGASAWNVLRLITSQGLQPVVIGMLIGIAGCLGLGRFIQNQLYGVSAFDPVTLIATAVSLLLIATIACGVPALRATKVDPLLALRQE